MKKLATLILAAGLVFGASTGASAIDFKAKGQWIMSFDYGEGGKFEHSYKNDQIYGWNGNEDEFEAKQRVRLQIDAVASESLSGTVFFEIGTQIWGKGGDANNGGAALGADSTNVIKLRRAYIDWMIPETDAKIRMGIQGVALPSFTLGSSTVFDGDVAGVTANFQVNENVGITAIWMRPYNDNWNGAKHNQWNYSANNMMDNLDLFALVVPLTFDGAKLTPWGMYGGIGPNTFRSYRNGSGNWYNDWSDSNYVGNFPSSGDRGYAMSGLFPVAGARGKQFQDKNGISLSNYGQGWWGGITGELTMYDPLRIAFDFTYGSVTWQDNGSLNRQGWLASLIFEYKMDWGIPGIYGWYGSGDDNNPSNGSERLPTVDANNTNQFSTFAFNGHPYIGRETVVSSGDMGGTWGIGAQVKDVSFIEDLKHTFRINYIGGTNSPSMGKKMSMAGYWANGTGLTTGGWDNGNRNEWNTMHSSSGTGGLGFNGMYLTTEDSALEFNLINTYKMYENFTIQLEADYIAMWLDTSSSVWGARHKINQSIPNTMDAWNINASFVYSF